MIGGVCCITWSGACVFPGCWKLLFRSMSSMVSWKSSVIVETGQPRATSLFASKLANFLKSSLCVLCILYVRSLPYIKLFSIAGGCADVGGIYRYRFMSFWYVLNVRIPLSSRVTQRSRKISSFPCPSQVQRSFPHVFRSVKKLSQAGA